MFKAEDCYIILLSLLIGVHIDGSNICYLIHINSLVDCSLKKLNIELNKEETFNVHLSIIPPTFQCTD